LVLSPVRLFLEKCTNNPTATSSLYCAAPRIIPFATYPDDWYKGVVSFVDSLWFVDFTGQAGTLLADLLRLSGREIDVSSIYVDESGRFLSFINKNDDTLWLYDLSLTTVP